MEKYQTDWNGTQVVFLAMVWADGKDYDLAGLVEAYDWVNHAIPSLEELQGALNVLLAMGLIRGEDGRYGPVPSQKEAFDTLRKKVRKDKFETVEMFFDGLDKPKEVAQVVHFEKSEFRACLKTYLGKFHSL